MSAAGFSISRSISRWRASARSWSGGSPRTARDESGRPMALSAVADQRLRRHHLLLERRRGARHAARLRDRARAPAAIAPIAMGAETLHRGVPRHAVPHAALSALFRRPLYR